MNKRFYWDANENLLLYTLPQGSVVANIGSKEYTEVSEQKVKSMSSGRQSIIRHMLLWTL